MAMARHAAEHGLIARDALADVAGEKILQHKPQILPTRAIEAPTAHATGEAVRQGALADALEQGEAAPANVEVEAMDAPRARSRR